AMPSGGLVAMGNLRALAGDLRAGLAALVLAQLGFLSAQGRAYDRVVAVGDTYALALSLATRVQPTFVGTAKSLAVAPYGPAERVVLRRARAVFVRDPATAAALERAGVAARAPGNVIADLAQEGVPPGELPGEPVLGLLPGSRGGAARDTVRLARVAQEVAARVPGSGALLSVAPTILPERLAEALAGDGWQVELRAEPGRPFVAQRPGLRLDAFRGPLGGLLGASALVIGQAGTANEAAAARGVPVVALTDGRRSQNDWYRMRQRRLLGEALLLAPPETAAAAALVAQLLCDPARRAAMGAAGRAALGPPGGAAAIAKAILASGPPA
ncbi:MAG: hypothetical protein ACREQ5_28810, partial [Candidatus Dormibacteria bacterium]